MGLNCVGGLKCRFFLIVNTTVLQDLWLVESMDAEPQTQRDSGYEGLTISYTWIFDSADSALLTPSMFKGQLYLILQKSLLPELQLSFTLFNYR